MNLSINILIYTAVDQSSSSNHVSEVGLPANKHFTQISMICSLLYEILYLSAHTELRVKLVTSQFMSDC